MVLAAALAGCGDSTPVMDPSDIGKQLLPLAGPLCTAAYGSSPGTPAPGAIKGKVVGFIRSDERYEHNHDWYPIGYALLPLHHRAEARSVEDVKAVACVHSTFNQVGVYQPNNVLAVRTDYDVRVIQWPGGEPLASKVLQGPDPPAQEEASKDAKIITGGSPTEQEMARWLEGMIAP
jgi:hypothetical protein